MRYLFYSLWFFRFKYSINLGGFRILPVGLAHGRRFVVESTTQKRTDSPVTSLADLINLLDTGDGGAANLTSLHAIMVGRRDASITYPITCF
jgi:hypothetical protein